MQSEKAWLLGLAAVVAIAAAVSLWPLAGERQTLTKPGDPLPGLSQREREIFARGKALFEHDFTPAEGLGPLFNGRSCFECHGKPQAAGLEGRDVTTTGVVRIGAVLSASPLAKDLKKAREQNDTFSFTGLVDKGGPAIQRRSITQEFAGLFPSDCNVEVGVVPSEAKFISLRHAGPLLGLGLIQAIDDQAILANMIDQAKKHPEMSGRTNPLTDPLTQTVRIGRFGWKDQNPDLLTFTAEALNTEMGVTTYIQSSVRSGSGVVKLPACISKHLPPEPNDRGEKLLLLAAFQALLAPPPPAVLTQGAREGERVFKRLGCAVCHTPEFRTPPVVEIADPDSKVPHLVYMEVKALEDKPVRLYSDLLLHRMGPDLADGIVQGTASGGEWRTPPLWGLRYRKFFLHDGRATTLEKAIRAHGGQAESAKQRYLNLDSVDKKALLEFLKAL